MRAAVAQSQERAGVGQHLANGLVVAIGVVDHREEQIAVLGLGEIIVSDLVGRASLAGGNGGAARLLGRLVVRRVSPDQEPFPAPGDELPETPPTAYLLCPGVLLENAAA